MAKKKSPGSGGTLHGTGSSSTADSGATYHQNNANDKEPPKLTRAQRRAMKKCDEQVDRILDTDRRFFKHFPHRKFRLRLAGQAELDQLGIVGGKALLPPGGYRYFMLVHRLATGIRHRLPLPIQTGSALDDVDLPEDTVREIWEAVSTTEIREIVRQIAEGGAA